jgi:hypothetical protein
VARDHTGHGVSVWRLADESTDGHVRVRGKRSVLGVTTTRDPTRELQNGGTLTLTATVA